ncbi:MAG: hypothetical protein V7707_17860 [Motiliproteus sp.]
MNNKLKLVFSGFAEVFFKQRIQGFIYFFWFAYANERYFFSRAICGNKNAKG